MNSYDTLYGYPKGKVARTILKEIYSDLNDHEIAAISVILVCHLMIEERINKLLFIWMSKPIPEMGSIDNPDDVLNNKKAKKQLEDNIIKLDFAKKIEMIKPLATTLWRKDGKENINEFYQINNTRNAIFHHLKIKEEKFKNKLLSTEEGIKLFQETSHQVIYYVYDLIEFINP